MKSNHKVYVLMLIPFFCFILGYVLSNILIGNKSYTAPNLIGLTMHEAVVQTSPFHINVQLAAEKECPGIAHGTIISQKPAAGRLIKPHQSIVVISSKLPETALAPNLLGLTETQALKQCEQQRIKCKTYKLEHQLPAATCIGQTPRAGQPLPEKKLILYTAHNPTPTYLMPNLTQQPFSDVLQFLEKQSVQIQVTHQNQKLISPYPDNMTIIAQKPSPGTFLKLENNLTIHLEVQ